MQKFYSHGKLLISGEYVVLDGATALALPTRFGQSMEVDEIADPVIRWKSLDKEGDAWFEETYRVEDVIKPVVSTKNFVNKVSKMLFSTLSSAAHENPEPFSRGNGFEIISKAEFPRNWGLGTSSTLVANIAKWLKTDAFKLLAATFGGSGYDVAVALYSTPVTFEKHGSDNSILKTSFNPQFADQLFFVHLNQKQNSRESIAHYRQQNKKALATAIEKISALTHSIISCTELQEFELLVEVHENIISQLTSLPKVKSSLFPDYPGAVKSLGGWGGDFVLATGKETDRDYFREKGYTTILSYSDMILG